MQYFTCYFVLVFVLVLLYLSYFCQLESHLQLKMT